MSNSAGQAHENGDCWPSQCQACLSEEEAAGVEDFELSGDRVVGYITGTQRGDTIELQVGRGCRSIKAHEAIELGAWLLEAAEAMGGAE